MPPSKNAGSAKQQASAAPDGKRLAPPPQPHGKGEHGKPVKPAKKGGRGDEKHEAGKHLRRAYEHLGRVEALAATEAVSGIPAVRTLLEAAQQQIETHHSHAAADLLRAAEHLSFAALAGAAAAKLPAVTPELEHAIHREFRKKTKKAEDHQPSKSTALGQLARETLEGAHAALGRSSFREALELVRAAEALAEAGPGDLDRAGLKGPKPPQKKAALKG